jgi:PKD repeat protein
MNVKNILFVVLALFTLLVSSFAVSAVVWNEAGFVWVNGNSKQLTIENGESAQFYSGDFGAQMGAVVNAKVELIQDNGNGDVTKNLVVDQDFDVCNGCENPFFIGEVSPIHYNNANGFYYLRIELTDNMGGQVKFNHIELTVMEPIPTVNNDPAAEFTYNPVNPLVDELIQFTSLSTDIDGDDLTYTWTFGDTTSSTLENPTHSYALAGQYTVTLTVNDENDGQDSVTHTVFVTDDVEQNHEPIAGFDYLPQPVFVGVETTFDASSSSDVDNDALTYTWTIDGNDFNGVETAYTFNAEGTYNVELIVEDEHGETDTVVKAVQVTDNQPQNEKPIADFEFDQPVYVGQVSTFTSTSTDDGLVNDLSYTWFVDGQQQLVEEEAVGMTFNAPGNYEVTLIVNDGELSDSITKPVEVFPTGNACPTDLDINYQPLNPEAGDLVTFTGSAQDADGDDLTYSWDFDYNGVFNTENTGEEVSVTYAFPGTYNVLMSVSDGFCQEYHPQSIVVSGGSLDFVSLECFDPVVQGQAQVCNAFVKNDLGGAESAVSIALYRETGDQDELLGVCTTLLAGKCQVMFTEENLGEQTVYATAQKDGFGSGVYLSDEFTYDVFVEAYDIVGLDTFGSLSDMGNDLVKDTFYRGEPMFVKFQVMDINTNDIVTDENVITSAALTSMAGGKAWLEQLNAPDGWNYYMLNPIPTNHEFYGNSQAFAFAFEFELLQGGQEYVDLLILNNPPEIVGLFDSIDVGTENYNLNLEPFESDVEDNLDEGDDGMMWQVLDVSGELFTADIVGKNLVIQPIAGKSGFEEVTLVLFDQDSYSGLELTPENPSMQTITVYVGDQTELSAVILASTLEGIAPLEVQFEAQVTGGSGEYSYEWDFNDGSPIVTSANPVHTFNEPGDYMVTLTVTDDADNEVITTLLVTATSEVISVDILVNGQNVGNFYGGGVPFSLDFTADAHGGFGDVSYSWYIIDNSLPNGDPNKIIFPDPNDAVEVDESHLMSISYGFSDIGNYGVYVAVVDNFGNAAYDMININAEEDELTSILLKASPQKGFAPLEVDFSVEMLAGNAPYDISIDFGDGEKLSKTTTNDIYEFTHIFEEEGDYEVVVKVTDGDSDKVEATVTIHVSDTKTQVTPRKVVGWTNLRLIGGEVYVPGDYVELMVNFRNQANWDLDNVKVTATIPELGIRRTAGPFDLSDGQEITKMLYLEIPYSAAKGEYDIRVTINADGDEKIHRIKHRRLIVE